MTGRPFLVNHLETRIVANTMPARGKMLESFEGLAWSLWSCWIFESWLKSFGLLYTLVYLWVVLAVRRRCSGVVVLHECFGLLRPASCLLRAAHSLVLFCSPFLVLSLDFLILFCELLQGIVYKLVHFVDFLLGLSDCFQLSAECLVAPNALARRLWWCECCSLTSYLKSPLSRAYLITLCVELIQLLQSVVIIQTGVQSLRQRDHLVLATRFQNLPSGFAHRIQFSLIIQQICVGSLVLLPLRTTSLLTKLMLITWGALTI